MEENQVEEKKGWIWLGFFFAPLYYAGYGNMGKGLGFAAIGAFPLFGLFIGIYGGLKAKKELPVGEVEFNWKNVGIALVVAIISGVAIQTLIASLQGLVT